jgi:uncharacterized phage-like protein YoqJ
MSQAKTLAFTGLKPHKLPFGSDEDHPAAVSLKTVVRERLVQLIDKENVRHFISGMGMGIGLICAEVVLELKAEYKGITLEAAIPFKGQDFLWPQNYRNRYRAVLERCDGIHVVNEVRTDDCFERRDRCMVDNSDILLVVWDGQKDDVDNILRYAKKYGKEAVVINPIDFSIHSDHY